MPPSTSLRGMKRENPATNDNTSHARKSIRTSTPDRSHNVLQNIAPFVPRHGLPTPQPSFTTTSEEPSIMTDRRRSEAPSASSSGIQLVGRHAKLLVDAVNELREFGVDHVVALPELVLVGDQSAGKSSLMGALAEIHLPRSAGCCTRCPAHIKTSPAPIWECKVSLQQYYSFAPGTGRPIESRDVNRNNLFPPWVEQALVVKPFKTIRDKNSLEHILQWAQLATLNPSKAPEAFVPGSSTFNATADMASTEAKFSPNVVSIEISGPDLPSLSFYDLPGVFQNAANKEDAYLVKVIQNLVTKYIKHEQALVICALPMSADPATSSTAKVISDLNAEHRCIGVLTKADQLPEGDAHNEFLRILNGQEHKLGHGYFVTRQPGHSHGSLPVENYHSMARKEEREFFEREGPWSSEWHEFRQCFGTDNLQLALSQKFAAQIRRSLPDIQKKIDEKARQTDEELERLPELPMDNLLPTVILRLNDFGMSMQKVIEGGPTCNEFQSSWGHLCEQFRDAILLMKPRFTVSHPTDDVSEVIEIDDDDDDESMEDPETTKQSPTSPTPMRKSSQPVFTPQVKSGQKAGKNNNNNRAHVDQVGSASSHRFATPQSVHQGVPGPRPVRRGDAPLEPTSPFHEFKNLGKGFSTIEEIRQEIRRHTHTGVPGLVDSQTYAYFCQRSVDVWKVPTELFFDITLESLRHRARAVLDKVLGGWRQTDLYLKSCVLMEEFFNDYGVSQRKANQELLSLETYQLFTLSRARLDALKVEELQVIRAARRRIRVAAYVRNHPAIGQSIKTLDAEERAAQMDKRVTDDMLGIDSFGNELVVAAYVRAYYRTAADRFVDSVCLSIYGKFFREAKMEIVHYLTKSLGIHSEERCKELLEENSEVARKRRLLKEEKARLQGFKERLSRVFQDEAALNSEDDDTVMA